MPTAVPIAKPPDRNASNCSIGLGLFSIRTVMPTRNGSRLTATAITRMVVIHMGRRRLGIQAGELLAPVQLDACGPFDLAACRGGNRPGPYQNEVRDVEAMRRRDGRRD